MFKMSFVHCPLVVVLREKRGKPEKGKSPQKTSLKIQKFINMHFLEEMEMAKYKNEKCLPSQ